MVSMRKVFMDRAVNNRVNYFSRADKNLWRHSRRNGALQRRKCLLVSRGLEQVGHFGEYLESFRLALLPTGTWQWQYFGTNREFVIVNRVCFQIFRHFRLGR
jgi:hypothetical protein